MTSQHTPEQQRQRTDLQVIIDVLHQWHNKAARADLLADAVDAFLAHDHAATRSSTHHIDGSQMQQLARALRQYQRGRRDGSHYDDD